MSSAWLPSARHPETDFPIENLPYGAFRTKGAVHLGAAIGDQIFDLHAAAAAGLLEAIPEPVRDACRQPILNSLMALGPQAAHLLRARLQALLTSEDGGGRERVRKMLSPQAGAQMQMPASVGDYTDFYASIHHATNVGRLFRPDNPLMPNYKYIPVGYHGRSSSIVVSPAAVRRPRGQRIAAPGEAPEFGPCRKLDYELEVGIWIGRGNKLGEPIPIAEADAHIFGFCLLNDWSARDLQRWEYQPLGPFLGKNFATSISPWVVTREALEPFRVVPAARPAGDPQPLPYLAYVSDYALDVKLEAWRGNTLMSRGNLRDLYWTPAQLVAHHTSNGCNLRPGDLLGTGTVSGPEPEARGCLLELGLEFLKDGEEVTLKAYCQHPGLPRIGFGACTGRIEAARDV